MKPLKAKPYDGQPVQYAQHKMDGHRLTVYRKGDRIECLTTTYDDLYPVLKDYWWANSLRRMPDGSTLDGEILVPSHPASYVKTAIKRRDAGLVFVPFAVPYWDAMEKFEVPLHHAADLCLSIGLSFPPYKELQPGWTIQELLQECRDSDLEGMVLKQANYVGWWKLKVTHTIDLIVTDITSGKGKYAGMVGSLVCSTSDGFEVAKVSGMSDAERANMSFSDIGRIVEVEYQSVLSRGRLQHPRFIRWREDKLVEDCHSLQDKNLWRAWNDTE